MNTHRPNVPKADVLAKYQETSLEPEEHRKMRSSKGTWQNRFEEAARLTPWSSVRTWLDVGCGTARFFERVIGLGVAGRLEQCVGIDAIANNLQAAREKTWPIRPSVRLLQCDIEDLGGLSGGPFDLVTMVGVVYQCGLPPAVAVEKCLGQLAAKGRLLVTTENNRFKGFLEDPHGCYPDREDFERMLAPGDRILNSLTVQYTNPLWGQRATNMTPDESAGYKEIFFLASYDGDTRR
jgi:SAM-dependent methyltransferase